MTSDSDSEECHYLDDSDGKRKCSRSSVEEIVYRSLVVSSVLLGRPGSYLSSFLQNTLKTNQVEINTDNRTLRPIAKLKEPRDLFALPKELDCPQQAARWPAECQVLEERIHHIDYSPSTPEQYYEPSGKEIQPKPVGEECGQIVFQYYPMSAVNYFSRSSIGGSRYFLEACPTSHAEGLKFESRFESGNLAKVVKITDTYYELYLRTDMYTNRHMQWYYFRVENTRINTLYRFSIVNMTKGDSLYSVGMRPLMYSVKDAQLNQVGWRRCGTNIAYFRNDCQNGDEDQFPTFTLTFTVEFSYDDDHVFFAHCYPYTYTDLQDYLIKLQNHPVKSSFSKLRLLCRSLAGNNVYYLTVTAPSYGEELKKKKAIVITARVHPGETPSSWMMKGFMDFLTGESAQAKELREKFIFKLVPMLNPDGVIVGNNRCSLTGRDLNRQYRTVIRETYPPVWYTKLMIRRLMEECGIEMYCDLHAHSRKHNIFIYGCENKRYPDRRLQEQVFPLMLHKNAADRFSFENCKFRIQHSKEGTGRVVIWMMGIANSYTMEASFGGSTLGSRRDTHFSTQDYEQMGRYFCETLLDFCDDEPCKERLRSKIIDRLLKEGSNADEPTNICLSDYSSDEGDSSSYSEDENYMNDGVTDEEHVRYSVLQAPPPSPVLPKREHHKSPSNKAAANKMVYKSPQQSRKFMQIHRTTIDLQTTDGGSDPCEALSEVESGDESPCRHSRRRNKTETSLKGLKCSEHCDMPPELIVTPAQVYESQIVSESLDKPAADGREQVKGYVREQYIKEQPPLIGDSTSSTRGHTPFSRSQSVIRHQNQSTKQTIEDLNHEVQVKRGVSLHQKMWTGIPCTCHTPTVKDTHWSSHYMCDKSEEALLISCSQKLEALKESHSLDFRSRRGPRRKLFQMHKQFKKVVQVITTDSSACESETELETKRKSCRKVRIRKNKGGNTSSNIDDDICRKFTRNEVKVDHPKKNKHGKKTENSKAAKQSLKWKFRKSGIVATAVSAIKNVNDINSLSETDARDKQDIKCVKKKKKKRKHDNTNKKTKQVPSSASVRLSPKKSVK